mmetsp:Transcript_48219/g.119422  ORF Transcript_48219/g.119422 Transcript_48219/m.119422 type:complete len:208 (+) Transcript_48219:3218-3841(+)
MDMTPADLKTCLSKIGSNTGSISSLMFSSSAGLPNCTAISRERAKSPSVSLKVIILLDFSMFFTHLFACCWGSIIRGQRRAWEVIMPLSTENESFGSPSIFQARIFTASPRTSVKENLAEQGTFFCAQSWIQSVMTRSRNVAVNGPMYETTPDPIRTSPTMLLYTSPSAADASVHRSFSPPSPPMSLLARSNFLVQSSACFSSSSLR